jgi:SAM-dependent methyltransferase
MSAHDDETLAFYARKAFDYATRSRRTPRIEPFIARLPANASVLDLGCGAGHDAARLIEAGCDVTPVDGSLELAAEAEKLLGRPVRVMRFDELDDAERYDGVWANASLLHAPRGALPDALTRVWRSLKPGGIFTASYKAGDGDGRDSLGRYYNFPTQSELHAWYRSVAAWREIVIETAPGGGYDGVPREWLLAHARK